jgi:hypothetical protein
LWTGKNLRELSDSLCGMGHQIGRALVGELPHKRAYRLQSDRKTREGAVHPDREAPKSSPEELRVNGPATPESQER